MTTPLQPNGMLYPTTPIILLAPSAQSAADAARQYGIDLDASAEYIYVVTSINDIETLVLVVSEEVAAALPWAVCDTVSLPVTGVAAMLLGPQKTQADLFSVLNNNVAWGRKWLTLTAR